MPSRSASGLRSAAPVFMALGDETRLGIVRRLAREGPLSTSRLAAGTPLTRQAVTKHLLVLGEAGLVRSQRRGRERIWRIRARKLEQVRRALELISAQWDEAIGRLQQLVEDDQPQDRASTGARPGT
ncbi:MAG TPA: metalloregulator ArsR/SmtB family transcription factor [Woeseiaceae bacterium]|nr:metalloregulator ArsR/SmtB family transcription factor [Woeseiaceae bacterium]